MRLELSRRADLALRAITRLAQAGDEPVFGRDLADHLETTQHFLPQVMKPLVELNCVASSPGPRGGYRLVADPADLTLLQIIEAIEGPFDPERCVSTGEPCPDLDSCALHVPWTRARHAVLDELGSVTLDVIDPNSRSGG